MNEDFGAYLNVTCIRWTQPLVCSIPCGGTNARLLVGMRHFMTVRLSVGRSQRQLCQSYYGLFAPLISTKCENLIGS